MATQAAAQAGRDADVEQLADWLAGEFDTFAQVAADETAQAAYRHDRVVLRVVPVTVPGFFDAPGQRTIYLEQAAAATPQRPYRQGVYTIRRVDGRIVTQTWRLREPAAFAGATSDHVRLAGLKPEMLTHLEGCDVAWTRVDERLFHGEMGQTRSCRIARNGGTWMTALNELTPSVTITLDRGFDEGGAQRWGPPAGVPGHMFTRRR
jgi:hypothetical protein